MVMLKKNIKVSIIVPVYNTEKYIDYCIKSLINQTERNIEIILINDGSTDNSGNIIEKWKTVDERIITIHNSNEGVSKSRNIGLENARGEYILFVDSDDWIDLETVEKLYEASQKYKVDYVRYGYMKEFIEINKTKKVYMNLEKEFIKKNEFKEFIYPKVLETYKFNSMCIF